MRSGTFARFLQNSRDSHLTFGYISSRCIPTGFSAASPVAHTIVRAVGLLPSIPRRCFVLKSDNVVSSLQPTDLCPLRTSIEIGTCSHGRGSLQSGIFHPSRVLLGKQQPRDRCATKRGLKKASKRHPAAEDKSPEVKGGVSSAASLAVLEESAVVVTATSNSEAERHVFTAPSSMKPSFYAVAVGKERGIYSTWDQCRSQVNGYSGAIYKSFRSLDEARAFLDAHPTSRISPPNRENDVLSTQAARLQPRGKMTRSLDEWEEMEKASAPSPSPLQRARVEATQSPHTASEGQRPSHAPSAPSSVSVSSSHQQVVYVDGACSHNGTVSARAGYGGYYGSASDPRNFALPVPRSEAQTNNRGELRAVIHGIVQGFVDAGVPREALEVSHVVSPDWRASELPRPLSHLVINTDSRYVIDGLTRYSSRWVENGFKLASKEPVLNQDLWRQLIRLRDAYNTCYAQQQHERESRQPHASVRAPPKRFHAHNTRNDETEGVELRHVKGHSDDHGNTMADMMAVKGSRMHDHLQR